MKKYNEFINENLDWDDDDFEDDEVEKIYPAKTTKEWFSSRTGQIKMEFDVADEFNLNAEQERTFKLLVDVGRELNEFGNFRRSWTPIINSINDWGITIDFGQRHSATQSGARIYPNGDFTIGIHRLNWLARRFHPESKYQLYCLFYMNGQITKDWNEKYNKFKDLIDDGINPFEAVTMLGIRDPFN